MAAYLMGLATAPDRWNARMRFWACLASAVVLGGFAAGGGL
jgi:hypothetical protein